MFLQQAISANIVEHQPEPGGQTDEAIESTVRSDTRDLDTQPSGLAGGPAKLMRALARCSEPDYHNKLDVNRPAPAARPAAKPQSTDHGEVLPTSSIPRCESTDVRVSDLDIKPQDAGLPIVHRNVASSEESALPSSTESVRYLGSPASEVLSSPRKEMNTGSDPFSEVPKSVFGALDA